MGRLGLRVRGRLVRWGDGSCWSYWFGLSLSAGREQCAGSTTGHDAMFTTGAPTSPVAITGAASAITQNNATISGTVDTQGLDTTYHFEYGMSAAYGTRLRCTSWRARIIGTASGASRCTSKTCSPALPTPTGWWLPT
jgi:hypothetical protein